MTLTLAEISYHDEKHGFLVDPEPHFQALLQPEGQYLEDNLNTRHIVGPMILTLVCPVEEAVNSHVPKANLRFIPCSSVSDCRQQLSLFVQLQCYAVEHESSSANHLSLSENDWSRVPPGKLSSSYLLPKTFSSYCCVAVWDCSAVNTK